MDPIRIEWYLQARVALCEEELHKTSTRDYPSYKATKLEQYEVLIQLDNKASREDERSEAGGGWKGAY